MKKLLLLFALMISAYGFSQQYGMRVGYNISNLDFDPDARFSNTHRNGFAIGFFAEYDLSKKVHIAPELQYSAEGAKEKQLRVNYIQLPVLFKFSIGDAFKIGAGPQAGFKIHDYNDGFKNFAFSGVAGLEYMFIDQFFVDARVSYGFTDVLDANPFNEAKNFNIQFGVGVKID